MKVSRKFLDNFKGSMLGLAIGDALGGPVEGLTRSDIARLHGKKVAQEGVKDFLSYAYKKGGRIDPDRAHPFLWKLKKGSTTDDTQQATHFAKALAKHGKFNVKIAAEALLEWRKENDGDERWPGPSSINGTDKLKQGTQPENTGSTTSKSCGSAMRVGPIGLFFHDSVSQPRLSLKNQSQALWHAAHDSSVPTHNSPVTRAGAIIVAEVVARALNGENVADAVKTVVHSFKDNDNPELLRLVKNIRLAIEHRTSGVFEVKKHLQGHLDMAEALPVALWAAMRHPDNFEKAVTTAASYFAEDHHKSVQDSYAGMDTQHPEYPGRLHVVNFGDTDSYASIAGAIIGARVGLKGIPKRFRKVENSSGILKLAEDLWRAKYASKRIRSRNA